MIPERPMLLKYDWKRTVVAAEEPCIPINIAIAASVAPTAGGFFIKLPIALKTLNFFRFFANRHLLFVDTDGRRFKHKDKAKETDNTHNERRNEYHFADNVVVYVVADHRKDNHR